MDTRNRNRTKNRAQLLLSAPERRIDDLLVFDASFVDPATRYELQRIVPQLVHIRRARKAHFQEHGCLICRVSDSTVAGIARKLHRRGLGWAEICAITGSIGLTTAERRQLLRLPPDWTISDLQAALGVQRTHANRQLKKLLAVGIVEEVSKAKPGPRGVLARYRLEGTIYSKLVRKNIPDGLSHRYGAGGLCDRCYMRTRRELSNTLAEMFKGRDAEDETSALTRRFDVARWLLSDGDQSKERFTGAVVGHLEPS